MNPVGIAIHAAMLADTERNAVLAAAVRAIVRPGDVVVDVGAGAGLLSLLAGRAGARRVFAIEAGSMAAVARHLAERNGFSQVIEVAQCHSRDFTPPEAADVVICETIGFAGLDEGYSESLADARERMLRPGGRMLPDGLSLRIAPVRSSGDAVDVGRLDEVLGFDFRPLAGAFRRLYRRAYVPRDEELASPLALFDLDSRTIRAHDVLQGDVTFPIASSGTAVGLLMWFEARLAPGLVMSNRAPTADNHWGQTFMPCYPAIDVEEGDSLRVRVTATTASHAQLSLQWAAHRVSTAAQALVGGAP